MKPDLDMLLESNNVTLSLCTQIQSMEYLYHIFQRKQKFVHLEAALNNQAVKYQGYTF